ncbi:angiotensin-converting enzyme-like [Lineus longissimus]|uniref:angiotensin-converting enzyme-like n=1 Tax=Lineus longissimus TaxID=88925 RepID=UPI002B4FABD1
MQWAFLVSLVMASAFAVVTSSTYDELENEYLLDRLVRDYPRTYLDHYMRRTERHYDDQSYLQRSERNSAEELAKEPGISIKCNDPEATTFFQTLDRIQQEWKNHLSNASFRYSTDVNDANQKAMAKMAVKYEKVNDALTRESRSFNVKKLDPSCAKMLRWQQLSDSPRSEKDRRELTDLGSKLSAGYANAEACDKETGECYKGETDLVAMFADVNTGYDKLRWAWEAWANATKHLKEDYVKFVELMNRGAKENGYSDEGEFWRIGEMDDKDFVKKAFKIWEKVKPMYEQLHAYVRHKLMERYPGKLEPKKPIQAHLLGNLWGQQWQNILPIVIPYPEAPLTDVTDNMKSQGYTVNKMFRTAEAFFRSIGLYNMTDKFWERSMFVEPPDKVAQCHASASDLFDKDRDDYRIKLCAKVSQNDLLTIHHEMGHVEYYMCYRNQPVPFRSGANTGFHEAVGDTIALSVMTPGHLQKIGLATKMGDSKEMAEKRSINFLMRVALEKLAFLPYGLLIDTWRWSVFNGSVGPNEYNHKWWDLRVKIQGHMPPVDRDSSDFDPGSKYHIPDNTPYIRYFVSFLTQFQFHKALCELAGHQGPLHDCDIYKSKAAGKKFKEMLSLGSSKSWEDAMQILTGKKYIDVTAIEKYFEPLIKWLKDENKKNGNYVGWETTNLGVKY